LSQHSWVRPWILYFYGIGGGGEVSLERFVFFEGFEDDEAIAFETKIKYVMKQ
jgi:hypothetical protein